MKRLIIDLDERTCRSEAGDYKSARSVMRVVEKIRKYDEDGFEAVLHTSRNIRTSEGNLGKIAAHGLPVIFEGLKLHDVPYDEKHIGKPWCGFEGFYVGDRAIRPSESVIHTPQEIKGILEQEK